MGLLVSKFRKKATTKEKLEQIEGDIDRIQSMLNKNHQQQKSFVLFLLVVSIVLYFIAAAIFYMFYIPRKWSERLLYFLPFLIFPVLMFGLQKLMYFVFVTRIRKNSRELEELKKEKKKILENVMETETYKSAKEILEKYDPNRRLVEKDSTKTSGSPPGQELRKRDVSVTPQQQMASLDVRPRGVASYSQQGMPPRMIGNANMISSPRAPMRNGQRFVTPNTRGPVPQFRSPITHAAPILPRDRSFVDKLAEYFVGDGPNNRYALICKQCCSHNGMALAEEFLFTSFKCCYCGFFNPARKQRMNAPRLENVTPIQRQLSQQSDEKSDNGETNETSTEETKEGGKNDAIDKEDSTESLEEDSHENHEADAENNGDEEKKNT